MDEGHLYEAVRYVSLNPVRARLVERAQGWKWSSVANHLSGTDDRALKTGPVLGRIEDFQSFLDVSVDETNSFVRLRQSETTGRPAGSVDWMQKLEQQTHRVLLPKKRGPKLKG